MNFLLGLDTLAIYKDGEQASIVSWGRDVRAVGLLEKALAV